MTGKKWLYWLGKIDGIKRTSETRTRNKDSWPTWASYAYTKGWYVGFYESSI